MKEEERWTKKRKRIYFPLDDAKTPLIHLINIVFYFVKHKGFNYQLSFRVIKKKERSLCVLALLSDSFLIIYYYTYYEGVLNLLGDNCRAALIRWRVQLNACAFNCIVGHGHTGYYKRWWSYGKHWRDNSDCYKSWTSRRSCWFTKTIRRRSSCITIWVEISDWRRRNERNNVRTTVASSITA